MSTGSGITAGGISGRDLRNERVRAVMRGAPLVIQSGGSLREGIEAIQAARADCVLIAEGEALVGILTERDLLFKVVGRDIDLAGPIDPFMTARPDAVADDASIGEALALMDRGGYRHVPIVDGAGRIRGLLRQQDVLAFIAEAFPESILNLPPRPHQRMEEPDGA